MEKNFFDPKRIGMVFCSRCYGQGYIEDPGLQCCPVCKGFGLIMISAPADAHSPKVSTEAWIPMDSLG